jgi:hypothetical protein
MAQAGPWMTGVLATIARHRAVLATVADMIVAAAEGKSLRVAVDCGTPDRIAFADQLTQALHARGRDCRCQTARRRCTAAGSATVSGQAGSVATVAVITSNAPGPEDSELCRIDIQVYRPTIHSAEDPGPAWDRPPDIVVDYLDPDGPVIRHIAPALAWPDRQ